MNKIVKNTVFILLSLIVIGIIGYFIVEQVSKKDVVVQVQQFSPFRKGEGSRDYSSTYIAIGLFVVAILVVVVLYLLKDTIIGQKALGSEKLGAFKLPNFRLNTNEYALVINEAKGRSGEYELFTGEGIHTMPTQFYRVVETNFFGVKSLVGRFDRERKYPLGAIQAEEFGCTATANCSLIVKLCKNRFDPRNPRTSPHSPLKFFLASDEQGVPNDLVEFAREKADGMIKKSIVKVESTAGAHRFSIDQSKAEFIAALNQTNTDLNAGYGDIVDIKFVIDDINLSDGARKINDAILTFNAEQQANSAALENTAQSLRKVGISEERIAEILKDQALAQSKNGGVDVLKLKEK